MKHLKDKIFQIQTAQDFNAVALEIFSFQYQNNPVYQKYCDLLNSSLTQVTEISQIPFLPIEFFKTHRIASVSGKEETLFHSSGTTGMTPSTHLIFDTALYEESILQAFQKVYGPPEDYCFIALIPAFAEKPSSSLAYMANFLIKRSAHPASGFYLGRESEISALAQSITDRKVFLWGLSFALADYAEQFPGCFSADIFMETGGMKGQRKEITREELHHLIKTGLGASSVHSEYSMCELLSQAWSVSEGLFNTPAWMKIMIRDPHDPLHLLGTDKMGGVNIIDLANIYTCSFIATQDLGILRNDGRFSISGRFDHSALRGCSLMLE